MPGQGRGNRKDKKKEQRGEDGNDQRKVHSGTGTEQVQSVECKIESRVVRSKKTGRKVPIEPFEAGIEHKMP